MRITLTCAVTIAMAAIAHGAITFTYEPGPQRWTLSNDLIQAVFEMGADGSFGLRELRELPETSVWNSPHGKTTAPFRIHLGSAVYDGATPFRLVEQHTEEAKANGQRQVIVLEDLRASARIRVELEMYPNQHVLRHRVAITNLTSNAVFAGVGDMLPYRFASGGFRAFHVDQWLTREKKDFTTYETQLEDSHLAMRTGAGADSCTWFATRDPQNKGLFAGWEFDGRTRVTLGRNAQDAAMEMNAEIEDLHHPIQPGETFTLPAAFLGVFQGDWDEASFRTQRFAQAVLAKPAPRGFPYVGWNSWGYGLDLNETILRKNAEAAAKLGIELFVVDLGWARKIGDWREDPAKFPSGLRALSDEVHRLGMKFGLHFALTEVAPDAPILAQHPDWTTDVDNDYFGAFALCLSNRPAREWLVAEAVRMIDQYRVDYIVQDGDNMVKVCRRKSHTHDPADSNYSNAVDGLNWVIAEIQRLRPRVSWENCEDGGNMMTFNMLQYYVTSITNDATGTLDARRGVWGATYPFPPRYANRYMPEQPSSGYITRSYMFGGPWHWMNHLPDLTRDDELRALRDIDMFKQMRALIAGGRVFHLTGPPGPDAVDAIESYNSSLDKAVVIVTRESGGTGPIPLRLRGFQPERNYLVYFADGLQVLTLTGRQLRRDGILVPMPDGRGAEIVRIDPLL